MARDLTSEVARLRQEIKEIKRGQRYAHGGSIENNSIEVKDGSGSLRAILGVQSDGTTGLNVVNGPPPPTPSAPILGSVLGGITVSWNGGFADATVPPLDWQRVEVHASTISGFTPSLETLRTTFETPQGGTVVVPCEEPVYVLLVARNTSGTASVPTVEAGPLGPAPVVATDLLDGIVTASKIAENAVTINALTEALADTAATRWVDSMGDATTWSVTSTGPNATWTVPLPAADAPTGQTVGAAFGYIRVRGTTVIPYDPDVLYRVSARVRATVQPTSPDSFYVGVLGLAADKVTPVNRSGANSPNSHTYVAASNQTLGTADGWVVVTGYLKGRAASGSPGPNLDPRIPGQLHTDVRYITPYVWLNYGQASTAAVGTMQVDAVTIEALKTGVVDSSNLVAGSVTTAALAADSVTATQILANAVTSAKINAGAVTTGKLDALAVTADKIAANAITAGKILAGAVDATALAADAITGKTITGGTITGAQIQTATTGQRITINEADANEIIVYDANGVAIGELSPQGLLVKGTSGAVLWLDPNALLPSIRMMNASATNSAYIQMAEPVPGDANIQHFTGTFTADGYTDRSWRLYMGNDFAILERIRRSVASYRGGRINLRADFAEIGYMDFDIPGDAGYHRYQPGAAITKGRHLIETQAASTDSALHVTAQSGHTGNLFRLYRDAEKFAVDKDGNTTIAGMMTAGNIVTGTTTITPSAAHTPTSTTVSFPALKGTTFRGYATAATTVPGVRTPVGAQGVTGVSVSSVTSTNMLVWVNRENTTATIVNWMVIGS